MWFYYNRSSKPNRYMVSDTPAAISTDDDNFRYIRCMLPLVMQWPRNPSDRFLSLVYAKYLRESVNRFQYSVLVHKAETRRSAVQTLSTVGAFATRAGRSALLEVVAEARNTDLAKKEVLDVLQRYAEWAFVLDGTDMTCGALPDDSFRE